MAYAGQRWIGRGAGVPGLLREQPFLHSTLLARWAVLALLCFLHAAYCRMGFFTRCSHRYMYIRMDRPHSTCGILVLVPPRLVEQKRPVGVEDILRATEFQKQHAEKLLDHIGGTAWHQVLGFVWYNWETKTVEPFLEDAHADKGEVNEFLSPTYLLVATAPPSVPADE